MKDLLTDFIESQAPDPTLSKTWEEWKGFFKDRSLKIILDPFVHDSLSRPMTRQEAIRLVQACVYRLTICETCLHPLSQNFKQCLNCKAIEDGLFIYLTSERGRAFINKALSLGTSNDNGRTI